MDYRIYLITNLITNKKYIGQTDQTLDERFKSHWNKAKKGDITCILHNSMLKYGIENFTIELIEDNISEEEIDLKETYYIDEVFDTFYLNNKGYNMTHGGQGVQGYKHTEETKAKLSHSTNLMWERIKSDPDEYNRQCELRSINHKGWKPSPETIQRMKDSAYPRDGELNPFYGRHHSDETKKQLSESRSVPVLMIDLNNNLVREFNSGKEASIYIFENKELFVNVLAKRPSIINSRINQVLNGKAKTAYGYKWKIKCID